MVEEFGSFLRSSSLAGEQTAITISAPITSMTNAAERWTHIPVPVAPSISTTPARCGYFFRYAFGVMTAVR
jgi:hypothetical protein